MGWQLSRLLLTPVFDAHLLHGISIARKCTDGSNGDQVRVSHFLCFTFVVQTIESLGTSKSIFIKKDPLQHKGSRAVKLILVRFSVLVNVVYNSRQHFLQNGMATTSAPNDTGS